MGQRFMLKRPHKGYLTASPQKRIAVISKSGIKKNKDIGKTASDNDDLKDNAVVEDIAEKEKKTSDTKKNENNIKKTEENMNKETIEEINDILSDTAEIKKTAKKVKVEKKEKGLLERTEDSTILITEDNKTLLTD